MTRICALLCVLALAGCGGSSKPKQAGLPPELAQSWAAQAESIGGAIEARSCARALRLALSLQLKFIAAVNAHRVPPRLQETLGSKITALEARMTRCPAGGDAAGELADYLRANAG